MNDRIDKSEENHGRVHEPGTSNCSPPAVDQFLSAARVGGAKEFLQARTTTKS